MVGQGLADVASAKMTPAACAIWIALPRLQRAGLVTERLAAGAIPEPERALYRLLRQEGGNAYGRYNALLRVLSSFEHALDHAHAAGGTSDGR